MSSLFEWLQTYLSHNPDWKQVLLIGMTPLFLMAFFAEYGYMRKKTGARTLRREFYWKDILANLSLGASYQVVEVIYYTLFLGTLFAAAYNFRLMDIEMTPVSGLVLLVGMEFFYYWFHRASHRIRWFWCAHVVHHSGEHMNMTTAMRQSLTYSLNLSHLFWVPLIIIGFAPWAVMLALAVNLAYQYFIHTQAINRLPGWVEMIFNTPSHHRVHHGRNEQYIDKNYGGILIIWDRLFGTFEPEDDNHPVIYGIPEQIRSYNFITLNFHEWRAMFADVMKPGPLSQRLKHLWAPPEWKRNSRISIRTDRQNEPEVL